MSKMSKGIKQILTQSVLTRLLWFYSSEYRGQETTKELLT